MSNIQLSRTGKTTATQFVAFVNSYGVTSSPGCTQASWVTFLTTGLERVRFCKLAWASLSTPLRRSSLPHQHVRPSSCNLDVIFYGSASAFPNLVHWQGCCVRASPYNFCNYVTILSLFFDGAGEMAPRRPIVIAQHPCHTDHSCLSLQPSSGFCRHGIYSCRNKEKSLKKYSLKINVYIFLIISPPVLFF